MLLAVVAAAGIGLAGASTTMAAPAIGSAIANQGAAENMVVKVRHCRYSHWRRWCHNWRWSRRW